MTFFVKKHIYKKSFLIDANIKPLSAIKYGCKLLYFMRLDINWLYISSLVWCNIKLKYWLNLWYKLTGWRLNVALHLYKEIAQEFLDKHEQ